jgi:hypothetical protein
MSQGNGKLALALGEPSRSANLPQAPEIGSSILSNFPHFQSYRRIIISSGRQGFKVREA